MNHQGRIAVFTSCNEDFIPQALVMFESIKGEDIDFFIACTDVKSCNFEYRGSRIKIIGVDTLLSREMLEKLKVRNINEFATSIKPYALDYLLKKSYENVFYLDPDICVYDQNFIYEICDAPYSISLTPHSLISEKTFDEEFRRIEYGIFNLGFLHVRNNDVGKKLAEWWKQRCLDDCFEDISSGIWTDQKFFDIVPCIFPDVKILRNFNLNLAYWNYDLHYPNVEAEKIAFIHWSSKDFNDPSILSKKNILSKDTINLEGRLLALSVEYNKNIKFVKQEISFEFEKITETYFYSNPLYSRLVSAGKVDVNTKLATAGFGNRITSDNFSETYHFVVIRNLVKALYFIFGIKFIYNFSRICRYLGKLKNVFDMLDSKAK